MTYSRPTIVSGSKPRGADWKQVLDQIDTVTTNSTAALAPGWTTYSPSWTASGSAPSIGNGTLLGRYRRGTGGDLVIAEIYWTSGSTTTYGTGTWFFSVPVTPSSAARARGVGLLYMIDFGTQDKAGVVKFEDATKFTGVAASGGVVTNTNPHTWATFDELHIQFHYEPL